MGRAKRRKRRKRSGCLIARLSIDPQTADFCDTGRIELADVPEIEPALDAVLKDA